MKTQSLLIRDILTPESIVVPLEAGDKLDAIALLVDALAGHPNVIDSNSVKQAVLQREQTRSTGIGHGVAIPHGRCDGCTGLAMAVGCMAEPIEFDALDGNPVDLIVLLASPSEQTGPHIQALAGVSRMLTDADLRGAIKRAKDPQSLFELITNYEN